jgi:predicted transcriptional regulator
LRKKATKVVRKETKRHVKREFSALEKNILWCFALGSKGPANIAESLDLSSERAREEVTKLLESGLLMERESMGGLRSGYELTAQGYEFLGNPGIKLDSHITVESLKSGNHAKLIVTAKNTGNTPITDALIKIVAPKFLTISRFGSEYERDEEKSIVQFPLTHLNPGETQTVEFSLHGNLTSGTVSSRYRVFVNALTGGEITDRKELGIVLSE